MEGVGKRTSCLSKRALEMIYRALKNVWTLTKVGVFFCGNKVVTYHRPFS